MKTIEQIVTEVSNAKTFSPAGISKKFNIELKSAMEIAELVSKNVNATRYFKVYCPACLSYVSGGLASKTDRSREYTCSECAVRFSPTDESIAYYYHNSAATTLEGPSSQNLTDERPALGVYEWFGQPLNKIFLQRKAGFIWHLSDLHLSPNPGRTRNGHCTVLFGKFFELLSERDIRNDVFIISGDCTDDGSTESAKAFDDFLSKLELLGCSRQRILFVPGNHDAWNGGNDLFRTVFRLASDKFISTFNRKRSSQKLPKQFSDFKDSVFTLKTLTMNEREIEFMGINTTIPHDFARGHFPVTLPKMQAKANQLRVAVMHHHLINDLQSATKPSSYIAGSVQETNMRIVNPQNAFQFLFRNEFDLVLNGHKHLQYTIRLSEVDRSHSHFQICAAPSLFEDKYDASGNIEDNNMIGFNILIPGGRDCELYFLRLSNNEYVLSHAQHIS